MLLVFVAALVTPLRAATAVTIGGPFELVAPDGRTVTDQTFRGKWLVIYFGYTSCPESCPTTLVAIADALARLGADAARVQALFVTLDPRHDTRQVMADYTTSFDRRILGLTGTPQQVAAVIKAYGVYAQPRDLASDMPGVLLDQSTYVYLMAPDGHFEQALDHEPPGAEIAAALHAGMARTARADAESPLAQAEPMAR